jgi:hypothetical protein
MSSLKRRARLTGLLYFLSGLSAPFGIIYVPRALIVPGDATATANHVRASEALLRMGIASELITATLFVIVALALYNLFKDVNASHARAMVLLYVLSVPISFLNVLNSIAALSLARGGAFLSVFDQRQLDALALLFLRLHGQGVVLAQIFWGLWLLPFGLLVIRSGFIPRVLGGWLIVNGLAYVALSALSLSASRYSARAFQFAFPLLLGELAIMLWLIVKGVDVPRGEGQTASA